MRRFLVISGALFALLVPAAGCDDNPDPLEVWRRELYRKRSAAIEKRDILQAQYDQMYAGKKQLTPQEAAAKQALKWQLDEAKREIAGIELEILRTYSPSAPDPNANSP
jgi:hypothetical protein